MMHSNTIMLHQMNLKLNFHTKMDENIFQLLLMLDLFKISSVCLKIKLKCFTWFIMCMAHNKRFFLASHIINEY